jgi:hypothetical protein
VVQVRLRMLTCGLLQKINEANVFNSVHEAVMAIVQEREAKKGGMAPTLDNAQQGSATIGVTAPLSPDPVVPVSNFRIHAVSDLSPESLPSMSSVVGSETDLPGLALSLATFPTDQSATARSGNSFQAQREDNMQHSLLAQPECGGIDDRPLTDSKMK